MAEEKLKKYFDDLSSLIFRGYIERDLFFYNSYITIQTLQTEEINLISKRYKYTPKKLNFFFMLDLSVKIIKSIGGIDIDDRKMLKKSLLKLQPCLISFIYKSYTDLTEYISNLNYVFDRYLQTQESKNNWIIFKTTNKDIKFDELPFNNQFRYYWILINYFKDLTDEERRGWEKVEFSTKVLGALTNPKGYDKIKNYLNIVQKLDRDTNFEEEDDENLLPGYPEEVKQATKVFSADKGFFASLSKKKNETDEQYAKRVEDLTKECLSQDNLDDHSKAVREHDMNLLKKLLFNRRKKNEVLKEVSKIVKEKEQKFNPNILVEEPETMELSPEKEEEQIVNKDFYYDKVNYFDIVSEKIFGELPYKVKKTVFDETMQMEIDLDKEVQIFIDIMRKKQKVPIINNPSNQPIEERTLNTKNAALKATKMKINMDQLSKQILNESSDDAQTIIN